VDPLEVGERQLFELLDAEAEGARVFNVLYMRPIERQPDAEVRRERTIERPLRTSIELVEAARSNAGT